MMYLTWLYCIFLFVRRVPSHRHTIFTLFSTIKVSVLLYPPSRFNPLPCGFTALAFARVRWPSLCPVFLSLSVFISIVRLSHDGVSPRPPDSVPWSLGFIPDFLPSPSPSERRLILSPNRCLVHSLLHRFIYHPLSLSQQPSLPGPLQQPLVNLLPGVFLPASFLRPSGPWPAVALTEVPPSHRPPATPLPGHDAFRLPSPSSLETLHASVLSRTASRWPLPFIQIPGRRGPLTTACRAVWFSSRFLSFIHCSFLSSVGWGACHCLEGCLAPTRWILRKHAFEF